MNHSITAIIPARGGSKGIPKKNIIDFLGKPLIAWTIEFALQANLFNEIIVSTDSEEIAEVAVKNGASVKMRPDELANDTATAFAVVKHAFDNYVKTDNIAYLQPTSPFRCLPHLEEAINLLPDYDSVVSVTNVPHNMTPESIMTNNGSSLEFYASPEKRNFTRQEKPKYVCRNGPALLLAKSTTVLETGSLYGKKIGGVFMDTLHSVDIDTPEDLAIAKALYGFFLNSEKI